MPKFLTNVSASAAWSQGMNDAAMEMEEGGMPIQWCMATPSDLMQALSYPSVTNFRTTTDYYYGRSWWV